MIGATSRRRTAIAFVVGLAIVIGFGLRAADPDASDAPGAVARAGAVAGAAAAADAALARLAAGLDQAREHAREGTALTLSGEEPAAELTRAADLLAGAGGDADAARQALDALAGISAAIDPGLTIPALSHGAADLEQMAGQMRAGAVAATLFVERRHATEEVVDALAAGLTALDRDDPTTALAALDGANAPLVFLGEWEQRPPLFGYWMMVSRDLVEAASDIARATLAGDEAAVRAAGERYAEAADRARGADNALAVALSEAGSAISATPLRRLAAVADEVDDARGRIQPLLRSVT